MKECVFEPQSLLVKNYGKLDRVLIAEFTEFMFLSLDGVVGYLIPKNQWILGKLKFAPFTAKPENLIGDERDYVLATIKGTIFREKHNDELLVLGSEKGTVYLNSKLLKNSFPKNVRLFMNSRISPVRVYDELDNLLGIILPVNYKEGDQP